MISTAKIDSREIAAFKSTDNPDSLRLFNPSGGNFF